MRLQDVKRTIVQTPEAYRGYAYRALSDDAVSVLFGRSPAGVNGKQARIHIQRLECFLRITRQTLTARDLSTSVGGMACDVYLSALYSEKFFVPARAPTSLYGAANNARVLFLAAGIPLAKEPLSYRIEDLPPLRLAYLDQFNNLDLDEHEVWLWSGWPSTSRRNLTTNFPFVLIVDRLGRTFVDRLHALSDEWFTTRRAVQLPVFRRFCELIHDYDEPICAESFLDREFITNFWRTLFKTHFIKGYADGAGSLLGTLRIQWASFRAFVETSLIPGQLVARHIGPFPRAPRDDTPQLPTNRRRSADGTDISTKLLTHIPLEISDDEAISLLFRKIENDLNTVCEWANFEVVEIWKKYEHRSELVKAFGESQDLPPRLTPSSSPEQRMSAICYAAARLRTKGYMPASADWSIHYRIPLKEAARELGLPTGAALLPHCILLAREHPAITPSFLENLELFNRNGQLTGFIDDVVSAGAIEISRGCG